MSKYTLGLDIGITSVGSCAIDQQNAKLIELSVRKFDQAGEAKEARTNRSARRTLRRKKWRKEQLLSVFNDFEIVKSEEIEKHGLSNYLHFYYAKDDIRVPDAYTIYHLRQKALKEKIEKREILLCLYNILQARGHFLFDNIDFTKDGLTFDLFKEKFYDFISPYIESFKDKKSFEENLLVKIYQGNIKLNDIKKEIDKNRFVDDEYEGDLCDLCVAVAGGKRNIGKFYNVPDEKKSVEELKKSDEVNEFQATLIELYDFCRISRILQDGCNYVCDIAVKEIDEYSKLKKNKANPEEFKKWSEASKGKHHIRSYKNLNNSYPNGLYVKEVSAILNNQKQFYPEITNDFIEICSSIVSAKIPYYIGPLGKNAKNRWTDKKGKVKYSYDYTIKHFGNDVINQFDSIRNWKENMVSHCTYLPDEVALPKGSLLGEIFSILNELNNFNCEDKNGNDYYLTREDKIKVLDELFMKRDNVTLKDVEDLLNLGKYYSQKGKTLKFNNKITVYKQIYNLCPELRLDSLIDIFKEKDKLEKIESIILDINLFDEGKLKEDYFKESFNDEVAKKLSLIKSKGFYSFSRKFIFDTPMNTEGESMMDILFNDNSDAQRNNQQVIVSNACDKDGNKIDFLANKYEKIIKDNNNELTIDLIIDKGKPLIPISRPVVRALNEAFKVYNGYLKIYGVPERVVVETAKGKDSIKDFTEQNGSPMKHYDKMNKLLDYLFDQINEKDKNNAILGGKIEEWNQLESYYNLNKDKIELYIRQDGIDLLTGKKIDITHLNEYEIDHILPRGFGDDSKDDKMLTSKIANGKKGDRLPIEFLESIDARDVTTMTTGAFTKIVNKLAEMKMISDKKQERLLLRNQEEAEGFINQNLVDTRYIISQFISMLNAFNKVNNYDTHVVCMNSSYTKLYSKILNFKKDRELGDQHHAYDAACLCIADKCLSEYFPNYDQRSNAFMKKGQYAGFTKYNDFIEELNQSSSNAESRDKLRSFVFYAFKKAYNQDIYKMGKEAPLLEEIKNRVPLLSWKVEKNYDGKLFDATLYKPKNDDDTSVLTLLGVNNDKRSFDSIYPVAVDFYKINHKHYAIHIPLVLIKSDGTIDKEKYLKLIKEHYKAEVLLSDDCTDINYKAFRFRAFKHDMIYDTQSNECHLFNLGSTANKLLELTPTNIFSYNSIYNLAKSIRTEVINRFNLKSKHNEKGIEFEEINKEEIVNYLCDDLCLLDNSKKHKERLFELMKDINNLNDFSSKIVYFCFLANDVYTLPKFDKRILPAANNNIISKNEDAEYIKIKHNILGVRFRNNPNGKLIVSGPVGYKNGGFKLIKKEEFHWTIGKDML